MPFRCFSPCRTQSPSARKESRKSLEKHYRQMLRSFDGTDFCSAKGFNSARAEICLSKPIVVRPHQLK
nr:MAG TPA: Spectrin like domain [Caudoviricetes sp.]